MSVRVLPDNLVNQIAAGEVVERPFSVVKELVENAIDAKAGKIDIVLKDGGKSLICITDNGKGMNEADLSLSVERHATSKLNDNNLFNIQFLGFRGEALPSIASVSRLTICTRSANAESAIKLEVNGGQKGQIEPCAGNVGSKIEVRDLFFNTPARLKFLKAASSEVASIVDVINKIALANPHISFTLQDDTSKKISYSAMPGELFAGRLNRITEVMGAEFAQNAMQIEAEREKVKISGFAGLPTYNKANSLSQYFFVNNRPVRDKQLLGALKAAYQDLIPHGRYPACVLFIDLPADEVDVNVHPTKAEVRFFDAALVRGLLISALRSALNLGSQKSTNVVAEHILQDFVPQFSMNESIKQPSYPQSFASFIAEQSVKTVENVPQNAESFGRLGVPKAQFNNTYIIAQTEDGIVIVDQHAAHERIVLEKMKENFAKGKVQTQMLLIPEVVELPPSEKAAILNLSEDMAKLGLVAEEFGSGAVLVREVPAIIVNADVKQLITDIAEEAAEWGKDFALIDKIHKICATIACHGSIRAGRVLNFEEMKKLLADMEQTIHSGQCNHGRPTYIELKIKDIEKLFLR